MAEIKVYNLAGKEVEKMKVSDALFALPQNDDLIHQVYVSISGNKRQNLADTKTRGERRGSGRKPWKQKGTGRARVGSVRTPLWKKGGVAFGPNSDRNFKKKINQKMKGKAIAMVISGKAKAGEIIVVDKLELVERKTKKMLEALKNLKIAGSALISFSSNERELRITSRNINKVENILTSQLNVFDMLNSQYLIMSKESIDYLENKYGEKSN